MLDISSLRATAGRNRASVAAPLLLVVSGCAAGAGLPAAPVATEAEWRALATPRPSPLPGAVRVSVGEIQVLGDAPWAGALPSLSPLGLSELVATGLLRRADVQFVERRRFSAAVEAERSGVERPPRAPPAGVSAGAELVFSGVWFAASGLPAYAELRLTSAETGLIEHSWRTTVATGADPVALARALVGSLLEGLAELGRLPSWDDPLVGSAPTEVASTGMSNGAVLSFLRGLSAEEVWDWESARAGYQAAITADPAFFEAEVALARAARLRDGGTLGDS